ncbi:ricin-type beta-trefoil lectin domain protein [Aeromonas sp. R2-1]
MHHHITSLQLSVLAMAALLLGGCALQPKPEDLLMGAAPKPKAELEATLVTSGGFCVTLSEQGRLLTQPCDQQSNQSFSWDVGALQLAGDCLVAKGEDGLGMEACREESHQWLWQGDRLFNRQVSLCLDVAGRRHKPAVPLRLAECYGGANQSFE